MPATFDHVTICVTDVDEALRFFGVLGFEVVKRVVATGPTMDAYMGLDAMRADHVTLAIPGAEPYQEVQLLSDILTLIRDERGLERLLGVEPGQLVRLAGSTP